MEADAYYHKGSDADAVQPLHYRTDHPGASGAVGADAGGAFRPGSDLQEPFGRDRNRPHERQCRNALEDFRGARHEDE